MPWMWVPEEEWERRERRKPLGRRMRKVRRRLVEWMRAIQLIRRPGVAK